MNSQRHLSSVTYYFIPLAILLMSAFVNVKYVRSETCTENATDAWENEDYQHTIQMLVECRAEDFGRNLDVDYMLGTSYCRLASTKKNGIVWLKWILERYSLDSTTRAIVEAELEKCGQTTINPVRERNQLLVLHSGRGAGVSGVSYRGKTFFSPGVSPVRGSAAEFVNPKPSAELRGRLVPRGESVMGLRCLDSIFQHKSLAGQSFVTEHFLVRPMETGYINTRSVGEVLELTYVTLLRQFGVRELECYITIYLAASPGEVADLAKKLHGLRVSSGTLGYSLREDLSLVASIGSEAEYLGTVSHELFHLMLRSSFGDVPPWLDEGLSSLFEVTEYSGQNRIKGGRNKWRETVLNDGWDKRPTLSALVRMNWEQYDALGDERHIAQASINQAYSRYFLYYLQEIGGLKAAYQAILFQTPDSLRGGENSGDLSVRVLSTALNGSIEDIQIEFEDWYVNEIRNN